jgi:hypothetical protein
MPTISISLKFWTAARNTMRPMRPKPLMPILMVIAVAPWGRKNSQRLSAARTVATTLSVVKPKCLNSAGAGADSP